MTTFGNKYIQGEVSNGLGRLRFFGLDIVQHEDFSRTIAGDEELCVIKPYPLSPVRRRKSTEVVSAIEQSAFMSVNTSIGWFGITSSLLCVFHSLTAKAFKCTRFFSEVTSKFSTYLEAAWHTDNIYTAPKQFC